MKVLTQPWKQPNAMVCICVGYAAFLTSQATMTHVLIPLFVINVLLCVSTAPLFHCCFVCISMKHVDVSEASTHFDGVVASTTVVAMTLNAGAFWPRVRADTLGLILQASIVITSGGAELHAPKNARTRVGELHNH